VRAEAFGLDPIGASLVRAPIVLGPGGARLVAPAR